MFSKRLVAICTVGIGGGCVKIAPPLCINKEAVIEGCGIIRQAIKDLLN